MNRKEELKKLIDECNFKLNDPLVYSDEDKAEIVIDEITKYKTELDLILENEKEM